LLRSFDHKRLHCQDSDTRKAGAPDLELKQSGGSHAAPVAVMSRSERGVIRIVRSGGGGKGLGRGGWERGGEGDVVKGGRLGGGGRGGGVEAME